MAKYFDVHPQNPQPRTIAQIADILRADGLVAYPTDSGYALGARLGSTSALDRIKRIRGLNDKHHFTLICKDFAQLGGFVYLDNAEFRAIKAATPGPYTFILRATSEVPRRMAHAKKKTVGARIPEGQVVQAILAEMGEPILSSSLILPDVETPLTDGWAVKEELDNLVDAVVDAGEVTTEPTTVIDYSTGVPEVIRVGAGDPTRFES